MPPDRLVSGLVLALALLVATVSPAGAQAGYAPGRPAPAAKEDGQWTMPGKDYASTRYSGLAQITAANARRLRPVRSFSTGVLDR